MTTPNDAFEPDAMLTAYVLGELESTEKDRLEARLAEDAGLRAEVEALRATTDQLHAALRAEPAPGLTDDQRAAIARGGADTPADTSDAPAPFVFASRGFWAGVGVAAAACIAVALWLPSMLSQNASDDFARGDAPAVAETQPPAPAAETLAGGRKQASPSITAPADRDAIAARASTAKTRNELEQDASEMKAGLAKSDELADRTSAAGSEIAALEETSADDATYRSVPMVDPQALETGGGGSGGSVFGDPGDGRADVARRRAARGVPSSTPAPGIAAPARRASPPPPPPTGGEGLTWSGGRTLDAEDRTHKEIDRMIRRRQVHQQPSRENYQPLIDNPFRSPLDAPLSTIATDVDTASYANVRRILNQGAMPPKDAVRIEEMINYFDYDYAQPDGEIPFAVSLNTGPAPWASDHRLVRIGLQAQDIEAEARPAANIVFLLDVSGSMNQPNKLPLVKASMKMLLEQLTGEDRVAIVTYAGNTQVALESTYCSEKAAIANAIDTLRAGGSTAGAAGIVLAYQQAVDHLIDGGVNRVVLCTDGDFNVGVSSDAELVRLIEGKRDAGVYLTVLGFGSGNWQDSKMEQLSNAGNGNFAYIDSRLEAKKVLVDEVGGTLVTVAKDVKFQVEFNPARVGAYRLIGYANRLLAPEDFNDDTKDAGDIGAGHTVTVLYEIVPPEIVAKRRSVDPLKYQARPQPTPPHELVDSPEMLTVKLRYKSPEGGASQLIEIPHIDDGATLEGMSGDDQFAAAVAAFGMILRDSENRGRSDFGLVMDLAATGLGDVPDERRTEFLALVERARGIMGEVEHRPAPRFDWGTPSIEAADQEAP